MCISKIPLTFTKAVVSEMSYRSQAGSETEPLNQKPKGDGLINKDAFIFLLFFPQAESPDITINSV